jgi:long-chain acyl-CoA synthetase
LNKEAENIAGVVLARAAGNPGRMAFVGRDGNHSYGRLAAEVERVASSLSGLPGWPEGNVPRIGVFCPDGVRHAVLMLAVMKAGGCAVPIAGELTAGERAALVRTTALHGVLSREKPVLPAAAAELRPVGDRMQWQSLGAATPVFPVSDFEKLAPAFVRFSSGTTGTSKGVVLSHATLRERLDSANRRLGIGSADRILWTLPMAHHFAVSILLYLREGATVILPEGSLGGDLLAAAREYGATVFYGSPFQAALLAAEASGRDWPALRLAVSTAAPLKRGTAEDFFRRYGVRLSQGFGIIEAGLPLLNTSGPDPAAVGVPDDFEVHLEDGELCLRGPGLFDAYLSPWRSRREVMEDGWFHTGDLARRGQDGSLRLVGRLKSVINFGGSKCFPEEIEDVLREHPGVAEARVSGEEHEHWGMLPVAEIVPVDAATPPSERDLSALCRERLAAHKVPVRYRVVGELPRTASGKIRRV